MSNPIKEFSQLVQKIYAGAVPPNTWEPFVSHLAEMLCAKVAVLIVQLPSASHPGMIIMFNAGSDPAQKQYAQYIALDPFSNLQDAKIVTLHDYLPIDEIESSEFFRRCLVPADLIFAMGVDLRVEGRYVARMRLARSKSNGNFDADEKALLAELLPHLRSSLNIYTELDRTRHERSHYASAMDRLEVATIILDETGRVIHTSPLAESLLNERDGIFMMQDFLALSSHEGSRRFKEMVKRSLDARREGRPMVADVMRIHRGGGRADLTVVVRPSSGRPNQSGPYLMSSVAVFLSVESIGDFAHEDLPSGTIQKLFGLTPKEAALALRLAGGRTLQEAAEELGITQSTARAHLRSIFSKTGLDRQTKLVRAILKSVAMLGT
jgi:DNA-binding CsgD family transcriptional regulator